jgi:vomeronasal1 receptor
MLMYIKVIFTVEVKRNFTVAGHGFSHAYCQTPQIEAHESWIFVSLILFRDFLFVVLMMWTSLYMVCLLYRHQRRAQHVHISRLSAQPSPENRATHSILFLMCFFLIFYCANSILILYSFYTPQKNPNIRGHNWNFISLLSNPLPFFPVEE